MRVATSASRHLRLRLAGVAAAALSFATAAPAFADDTVMLTTQFATYGGTVNANGEAAPIGTVIRAWCPHPSASSPTLCGRYVVGSESGALNQAGTWRLDVYGADVTPGSENYAQNGDVIAFTVNGIAATASTNPVWEHRGADGSITLNATVPAPAAPGTVYDGPTAGVDADFTTSTSTLSANWPAGSGAAGYLYAIGTSTGGTEVRAYTDVGSSTSVTASGLSLVNGTTYFLSVRAYDSAQIRSTVATSDGITVDTTAPAPPALASPSGDTTTTDASIAFTGTAEVNSLVRVYVFTTVRDSLAGSQQLTGGATSFNLSVPLPPSATTLFVVTATDGAGNESVETRSPAITQDAATPTVSSVTDDTGWRWEQQILTVHGSNFQAGATLRVGEALASNVVVAPGGATLEATRASDPPPLFADVNDSGDASVVDALCILRQVVGLPPTTACPVLPPGQQAVDVVVTNPGGKQGRLPGGFAYLQDPGNDGQWGSVDALCVLRFVVGLPATGPCPREALSVGGVSQQAVGAATSLPVVPVEVGSITLAPGAVGSTRVVAVVPERSGPGAWTVDVTYDPSLLQVAGCASTLSTCNSAYGPGTVRLSGASAVELSGTQTLATLDLRAIGPAGSWAPLGVRVVDLTTVSGAALGSTVTVGGVRIEAPPLPIAPAPAESTPANVSAPQPTEPTAQAAAPTAVPAPAALPAPAPATATPAPARALLGHSSVAPTVVPAPDATLTPAPPRDPIAVLDGPIPGGHFYKQANGLSGAGDLGFGVVDDAQAALWTAFQAYGGAPVLGYPISGRFEHGGYLTQAFQKLALQWRPELDAAVPVNVLDDLNQAGADSWLDQQRQVPPAADTTADVGLPFGQVAQRHIGLLDAHPALRAFYLGTPDYLDRYGLPLSVKDYGPFVAVRLQRATLQLWKQDTPWAPAGTVVVGNASDLAKESGLWPSSALAPHLPPPLAGP